ncbi:PREDICTED: uncharacterized protein LOC106099372 [Papilio polytes]|uniref:uncharacterized protein LOC106099372 n=1 Tax=Papilio polytes TaxID=76194 RepID=UPI0006767FC8|nr:PREDICTED: uncharacterized protein LOC106099372 [Papilio polytes]
MNIVKECFIFLAATSSLLCESAFVDTLQKCSIKDNECFKNSYQTLIETLAEKGATDIGVNKIDPMELKDVHVSILDLLNLTLEKGDVSGIKTCTIKSYRNDIENRHAKVKVFCKHLEVQGNYQVELVRSLLNIQGNGDKVHGAGHAKVIIDKIESRIDFPYQLEKRGNDIYLKIEKDLTYSLKVLGKATFVADNLIDGDSKASENIIKYMNEHWKVILDTFGKVFFDKTIEYVQIFSSQIFDKVPTKHYIIEDLSAYVEK